MKRLIIVAALSAPLAASPVSAQLTADRIPRDVVLAILRNGPMQDVAPGDPAIVLDDHLPANLINKLSLPPGAHVVATLANWSSSDVIGSAPITPDSVRSWFAAEFTRRKYEAQTYPGHRGPFRPAEGGVDVGYCGGGAYFSVTTQERPGGRSEFVIHARQRPNCEETSFFSPNVGGTWSSSGDNPPPLPRLVNPQTAEVAQRCDSRYGHSSSTQVSLSTAASPEQLLTHYGKQLDSAGWKRETVSTGTVGTWVRRDSTGRSVRVQLTALPGTGDPDCRMLTMTTTEARP